MGDLRGPKQGGRRAALSAAVALALAGCTSGGPSAGGPASTASDLPTAASSSASSSASGGSTADWLTYHADRARTGAVAGPSPAHVQKAWSTQLGGAVRGQPLVAGGRIIAATETNRVVALDPATGAVSWSTVVGTPLTQVAQAVGCGNVDPLGITGTPVVDPSTGTVWVVAEVSDGPRSVRHQLVGLDLTTGAERVRADVDPPLPSGESALHLLQRPGLALGDGRLYVSFGGHLGDCGRYHGWVVGAETADPRHQVSFQATPDGEGGAIWQGGGAPAVDAQGNVYVATGNTNPFPAAAGPDPKQYAESVVKLSPELRPLASYKDRTAGGDEDLSTGNPVLLPDGTVFAVGKTNTGFVLRTGDLSPVGTIDGVCSGDPAGGPAYHRASNRIFVACRAGGLQVVDVSARRTGPLLPGADSAPIIIGDTVWALDSRGNRLLAFSATDGTAQQTLDVGADVPVFASPSTGLGLVLVGTTSGVTAFR
jgi:outer membrane protein assembly factor BamB